MDSQSSQSKTRLSDATLDRLQDLIQVNIDSRDGLAEAAVKVEDATLAATMEQLALERNDQVSELRTLVGANSKDPQNKGSVAAAAHRAWMDLRAALGGGPHAILSEAERGEDHIKSVYEKALEEAEPAVADVIGRQYAAVKKAHDRIAALRDEYQNG